MTTLSPKDRIPKEHEDLAKQSADVVKNTLDDWENDHIPPNGPNLRPLFISPEIDFSIPDTLLKGTTMIKVSGMTHKKKVFQLDPDEGHILYKKSGKIGIGGCLVAHWHLLLSSLPDYPTFYQYQSRASQRSAQVQMHDMIASSLSSQTIPRNAGSQ